MARFRTTTTRFEFLIAGLLCCSAPPARPPELDEQLRDAGDAPARLLDAGPDKPIEWPGPWGSLTGSIASMEGPLFDPFSNLSTLTKPAMVHFPLRGVDYTARFDPPLSFTIEKIPATASFVMAEDIDDANGILPTCFDAVPAPAANKWAIPAFLRSSIEAIYAPHALTIDPEKAQVMMTFNSSVGLREPLAGIRPISLGGQRILYGSGTAFYESDKGTTSSGIAVVANVPADPYPGGRHAFEFKKGDEIIRGEVTFPLVRGCVTRVIILAGGVSE